MAQVTQMTQGYPINLYKVNSISPQFLPLLVIVEGGNTGNEDTFYFILTRAFDLFWTIGDTFDIAMASMRMAYGYYVGLRVAQRVTGVGMAWISKDRCFFPFDPKASVP